MPTGLALVASTRISVLGGVAGNVWVPHLELGIVATGYALIARTYYVKVLTVRSESVRGQ